MLEVPSDARWVVESYPILSVEELDGCLRVTLAWVPRLAGTPGAALGAEARVVEPRTGRGESDRRRPPARGLRDPTKGRLRQRTDDPELPFTTSRPRGADQIGFGSGATSTLQDGICAGPRAGVPIDRCALAEVRAGQVHCRGDTPRVLGTGAVRCTSSAGRRKWRVATVRAYAFVSWWPKVCAEEHYEL